MSADTWAGPALGAAWSLVVALAAVARLRRHDARRPDVQATAADMARGRRLAAVVSPVARLGAMVRRLVSTGQSPAAGDVPGPPGSWSAADRRVGWAVVASLGLVAVAPPLAALPLVWILAGPALAARRSRARHETRLHDQLPDVVDLISLTSAAGLTVAASLLAIGDRPGGPLGHALASAGARLERGGTTAEALATVATLGPPVRPLVDALAQHDRYGTPLLGALDRVAVEARATRRRRSEEAARRLPVTLLFPLVLTVFPAFVLLTVVPLLAGSLGSLSLTTP